MSGMRAKITEPTEEANILKDKTIAPLTNRVSVLENDH